MNYLKVTTRERRAVEFHDEDGRSKHSQRLVTVDTLVFFDDRVRVDVERAFVEAVTVYLASPRGQASLSVWRTLWLGEPYGAIPVIGEDPRESWRGWSEDRARLSDLVEAMRRSLAVADVAA